ncbi:NAD(P)/FAD-dependent oxidoreductase [Streptomyces sp. NPDC053427]|uniref:NAD(P)/FAD-dependent oxidoreductase n=1 Tax=Streptomyces sp. NPDC053427 TaxID=3365701 RepID=UPI0037CF60E4
MSVPADVVIVGASAAGLTAAETLRRRGYGGRLTLLGAEPHPPYDRPPLSKHVLAGAWEPDRIALRAPEELTLLDAEWRLGRAAAGLELSARQVVLDGGERLAFDGLIVATGVAPRRLPGADLAGVHVLRTVDDALALRQALLGGPRVVVVGAGFLGVEVAATARTLGLDVTVAEPQPVPVYRPFGERIGALVARLHLDHGTRLRCGMPVRGPIGAGGRVTGVELADGTVLPADVVVLAVGSTPATGWLEESGLPLNGGISCDERCRAAPGVYAAGDVASWPNPHFGTRMRVEHRTNATEQAMAAAGNLLGDNAPFAPVPYFWSDQYDTRIQAYGIFPADAEVRILHGDPADRRFVAAYGRRATVVGVVGWNAPRETRMLRRLVAERAAWPGPVGQGTATGNSHEG